MNPGECETQTSFQAFINRVSNRNSIQMVFKFLLLFKGRPVIKRITPTPGNLFGDTTRALHIRIESYKLEVNYCTMPADIVIYHSVQSKDSQIQGL
jgi:hypothetical protein